MRLSFGKSGLYLVMLCQLVAFSATAGTAKFAIVLGNNLGHAPVQKLDYAEQDARRIYSVLTELGGFSPKNATLLIGADAATVWKTIHQMEKRILAHKRETGNSTLLVFFYSGHAEGDVLELGRSSLRYDKLLSFLKDSFADVRLAFLDSCQSGGLISKKGGLRGPGFDIQVTDEITSKGYAIITSSAQNELSQESAEIRGAFFTNYLVSALRGAGDASGDGRVTLSEAYKYAYAHTLARTSATIGGTQHPMYEFELHGRGEITLTNTDRTGSTLGVSIEEQGRLVLLDDIGDVIVAETEISPGVTTIVAVRPGTYRAYLLAGDNAVRIAVADVKQGQRTVLGRDDFETTQLETTLAKGGMFRYPAADFTHRVGVGGLWRMWPLEGAASSYGATVHYRFEFPKGWEPSLRLSWTTLKDVGVSTGYNDLSGFLGMGYVWHPPFVDIRAGLSGGYEYLFQDKRNGRSRHTSGFSYQVMLGLEIPISIMYICIDGGTGGRVFQVIGKGWVHRLDLQVMLGLGWKWGN